VTVSRITPPRSVREGAPYKLIAALVVAIPLAGCGYKAPLYLPKPKPEGRSTPPAIVQPEPPPERPVPAESAPQSK
jgi:predicted small lipoprotein YifL